MKFLKEKEIRKSAPSVFTQTPSREVSSKYTHIPTTRVISDMEVLGWGVVSAQEVRTRKYHGYQKHLLTFRNPEITITGKDGDTVYPQIVVTNSHDGKSSFTFTAGLFRLVCSNGLVIADEEFANMKIRHMGYSFEELQELMKKIVETLPLTVECMNRMRETEMTEDMMIQFATDCIQTRFTKDQIIGVDMVELLNPTRKEDMGSDLWNVFNVVQEKVLAGDFQVTTKKGKIRKAREVKNFILDQKINKELYQVALNYMN